MSHESNEECHNGDGETWLKRGLIIIQTEENVYIWKGHVFGQKETPYAGGKYPFKLTFPDDFPFKPPTAEFLCKMWHANIGMPNPLTGKGADVCVNTLKDVWTPCFTVRAIMQCIVALLGEPNTTDPMNHVAASQLVRDKQLHDRTVEEYTGTYASWKEGARTEQK